MLVGNPAVGLAYRFPNPSAKTLPTDEKTFGLARPVNSLPMPVLLPTKAVCVTAVAPVVPGGVTGITGRDPLPVPAAAPSRKNPDLEALNPNDPTKSPFPEHCRACIDGAKKTEPATSSQATVRRSVLCFIDSYLL